MAEHGQATPFALLVGATYYAVPGWRAFRGTFATLEAAVAMGQQHVPPDDAYGWWQVIDLRTCTMVAGAGYAEVGGGHCRAYYEEDLHAG
jgi:hypothetical protein